MVVYYHADQHLFKILSFYRNIIKSTNQNFTDHVAIPILIKLLIPFRLLLIIIKANGISVNVDSIILYLDNQICK